MKTFFEIRMLDDPIGHFRCLLNDNFGRWLTSYATKHDEHFLLVNLRGFLYIMLATLVVADRDKKIRRQQLINRCLSQFSDEVKLIDDPIEKIRWILLPKYCRELEVETIKKDRGWAHQTLHQCVLMMLAIVSLENKLEKSFCKNSFNIALKSLANNL